ncbi:MAG: 2-oxo-4-hydroxy-4-carboxy-5-ureidoimidazoline decarboxylase [Catenulispora sp.]|nr:2-oxo-4-hydroxy-4-carboxy-5-ureidoimidazoline decarboxylase [Catenulispora sp.]
MEIAAGRAIRIDRGLAVLDALDPESAAGRLTACCASDSWVAAVVAARPFRTVDRLYAVAAAQLSALQWPDILQALAAHPRIGSPATTEALEARWSRAEQAGAADADATTADALVAANVAYEEKFGFVFLIRASGRSAQDMLAAAVTRLGHDELTERSVVRGELAQIVRLRLDRLLDDLRQEADAA